MSQNGCLACRERVKNWKGEDPQCAFTFVDFDSNNWNCATIGLIREICDPANPTTSPGIEVRYHEDQWDASIRVECLDIPLHPTMMWLSWYKRRGRTDAIWLLFPDRNPLRPTEADCTLIIGAYCNKRRHNDG